MHQPPLFKTFGICIGLMLTSCILTTKISSLEIAPNILRTTINNDSTTEMNASLDERIDLLFAGDYAAGIFVNALNKDAQYESTKTHSLSWKSRPSCKEILNWGRHALGRFWQGRGKQILSSTSVGAFFIGLGALCLHHAQININSNQCFNFNFLELMQLLPRRLLTSIPQQMTGWFFLALCHEAGHTLAHYLANGHIPSIYLGADSLKNPSNGIEILPHVNLCGIDPTARNSTQPTNLSDLFVITTLDQLKIEKTILRKLALEHPDIDLRTLRSSPDYTSQVYAAMNKKHAINHGKIAGFFAAGPLAGLASNAIIKTLNGTPLSSLDAKDFNELFNLLPTEGNDGQYMIKHGFKRPDIAKSLDNLSAPIFMIAALAAIANILNTYNFFTPTTTHSCPDVLIKLSSILRTIGVVLANLGGVGFIHITPESAS